MEVRCPTCGARVPAADVNLDRLVAKCAACDAVFDFSAALAASRAEGPAPRRPRAPRPATWIVEVDEARPPEPSPTYRSGGSAPRGDFVVRFRWFGPKHLALALFCLVWDGFLAVWYGAAITGLARSGGASGPAWLMVLFPAVHVAVGVGLTYTTLAGFVNSTRVGLRDGALFVRHGPLPWRGGKALDASTVTQLFVRDKVTPGRRGDTRTFELAAVVDGEWTAPFVTGLDEVDQARWLEEELEARLGIADEPVKGELA
jgi:hypothetical protein